MATAEKRVVTDATGQAMLAELRKIPGVMNPVPVEKGGTGVTTPEEILELIGAQPKLPIDVVEELGLRVKSVNGNLPDDHGNVTIMHVQTADNLSSDEATAVNGTFIRRTTGGDASISDGTGTITALYGYSIRSGYSAEQKSFTVIPVGRLDDSVIISAEMDWDTYRTAHPFYTIMVPERVDGFVNSLIENGEAQGFIPIWALWGKDNYCMVANHGVAVVAEAYRKGFRGFDAERALNIMKRTQTESHKLKSDWETYMKYSYFPTDLIRAESVSSTLESVYDDYAVWDMATRMGKKEDIEYYGKRKDFYKNLFDTQTQFMRPRKSDGTWKSPFDPSNVGHSESVGGDYTEGNAWQYTWHVQHDVPGLIELFGGEEPFLNKLDSVFTVELKTNQADVTGLIGQYAHGNEPSHHVAYLYTMAGKPERTQELIRQIFDTQYRPEPDGLCGNDDCGQMSAWYMFSAMGFYPVDPVSGNYVFGAPQMPKIVLNLTNGKTFTVIAEGISEENKYVESITLNSEPYTKNYITHEDIVNGGTLVFKMKN